MTQYLVGYYKPSFEFTRIPEFMAIFDHQGMLIGLTGPSTSRQAALDARLFAAAPELLSVVKNLCWAITKQSHMQTNQAEAAPNDRSSLLEFAHQAEQIVRQIEHGVEIGTSRL
jgi:hypothetical protein